MKTIKLLLVSMLLYVTTPAQLGFDTNMNKTKHEIRVLGRENIQLELSVYIDNKLKADENYLITIQSLTQNFTTTVPGSNQFILYLHYDNEYILSFTHKGCNTRKIYVNTSAPYDNWHLITQIKLQTKSNEVAMVGKILYDEKIQNFKAINNE